MQANKQLVVRIWP